MNYTITNIDKDSLTIDDMLIFEDRTYYQELKDLATTNEDRKEALELGRQAFENILNVLERVVTVQDSEGNEVAFRKLPMSAISQVMNDITGAEEEKN